jgi:hypothetical protein
MTRHAGIPRAEGAILGRYLLGREAPPPALQRYAEGCARLFVDPPSPDDAALVAFAVRHPWSLPCLDAAAGLLRPRSLLRQKLILMLAVLETLPECADDFLPAARPPADVLVRLALSGASAGLKIAAGLLILPATHVRWGGRGGSRARSDA